MVCNSAARFRKILSEKGAELRGISLHGPAVVAGTVGCIPGALVASSLFGGATVGGWTRESVGCCGRADGERLTTVTARKIIRAFTDIKTPSGPGEHADYHLRKEQQTLFEGLLLPRRTRSSSGPAW